MPAFPSQLLALDRAVGRLQQNAHMGNAHMETCGQSEPCTLGVHCTASQAQHLHVKLNTSHPQPPATRLLARATPLQLKGFLVAVAAPLLLQVFQVCVAGCVHRK